MVLQLGKSKAYIDLVGMKTSILWLMKKPFPIVMAVGTATQFGLAAYMIWFAQGGWSPAAMKDAHATAYFVGVLRDQSTSSVRNGGDTLSATERLAADQRRGSEVFLIKDSVGVAVTESPTEVVAQDQKSGAEVAMLKGNSGIVVRESDCRTSGSVRDEWEMDHLFRRPTA
jgi:hypothetical protein